MKQRGRYRIQTVSRMTGVPAPTLRAWERRYGIPTPERTGSSYRLYSDDDVTLIKRLRTLTDQGVAPSEAAELVREAEEAEEAEAEATAAAAGPDPWQAAIDSIVTAVRRFDPTDLEQNVRRAMLLGSARLIFDRVFAPAMRQIGDEWHAGRLSIAQEHLATVHLGNATRELLRLVQPDAPTRQIVLGCVEGEQHLLPLYGSALHFVQWGYRVVILGSDTPPEALAQAIASLHPNAVGLSMTQALPPDRAALLFRRYADACGPVPWMVGGSGTRHHAAQIEGAGGLVAGETPVAIREALDERIMHGPR
ncbi:MAG: MerR family transcriptional regulator [Myxococcales bacterium]|nr:MerR family transcriptional regulator [Myxococcales bacterium]MCB9523420.1 MerR family transcriptional regulator [Myxococcales bacterium]